MSKLTIFTIALSVIGFSLLIASFIVWRMSGM